MKVRQLLLAAILSLGVSVARAEVVNVSDDHGGLVASYQMQWTALAARGVSVRIVGPCVSACTVLVGHIPRDRICVAPGAYFGFHWATVEFVTRELWNTYPEDIRKWITDHGGLTNQLILLQAPDIYRYFRKCSPVASPAPRIPVAGTYRQ